MFLSINHNQFYRKEPHFSHTGINLFTDACFMNKENHFINGMLVVYNHSFEQFLKHQNY